MGGWIYKVAGALVCGGVVGVIVGALLNSVVTGTSTSYVLLINTVPFTVGGATALIMLLKLRLA